MSTELILLNELANQQNLILQKQIQIEADQAKILRQNRAIADRVGLYLDHLEKKVADSDQERRFAKGNQKYLDKCLGRVKKKL